ncbi:cobalt-precorrin-6A reductase [Roseibium aggregatum]|uniref:cobalt-precorrin-6A reductase n=1 Tax=Roseibium aggregatum TaxID=187304 RepID=UPI003A96D1F2
MTAEANHILLLAGTSEARQLGKTLAEAFPESRLTASFAGVVRDLPDLGVPTRVGGFGGVEGLLAYLRQEKITAIVDATHPFAAQMSHNAAEAAKTLNMPLLRLERPSWQPGESDRWTHVVSMDEAAMALPTGARAFLAIGRKEIERFTHRTDIFGLARMIEPPPAPLPGSWELLLSRPPASAAEEISLFRDRNITHVVTKNSGGSRSFAKIEAARALKLPVIMIARPQLPDAETAPTVAALVDRLRQILANRD